MGTTQQEPVVDLLEEVWSATAEATDGVTEEEWARPSELPGWSVKDCLNHVTSTESSLLGEPAPQVPIDHLAHVVTPFQAMLEVGVEAARGRSGAESRQRFLEVVGRRVAQLRAMGPEGWDTVGWSPIGEVPYRDFMRVRVFDCWMHEQDIRRALDRPGHLEGRAVEPTVERFRGALGFVVGKKVGAPDGTVVVLRTTGPPEVVLPVVVAGRAPVVDEVELTGTPAVEVVLPFASLVALGGGRWDRARAEAAGGIAYEGDADLGRRVLDQLAFTP